MFFSLPAVLRLIIMIDAGDCENKQKGVSEHEQEKGDCSYIAMAI